jgi:hypothetical protein
MVANIENLGNEQELITGHHPSAASKRDVVSNRYAADCTTLGWAAEPRKCWSGWYEGS